MNIKNIIKVQQINNIKKLNKESLWLFKRCWVL